MAFHNLAREYSTTTGTSDAVLTGAVPGCNTWEDAGVTNAESVRYGIITYNTTTHRPTHSEIGTGTYTTATNTLARTTVISSTNSGSKITLTGLSEVFITPAASDVTLIVQEQDAAPSVTGVTTIKVTNGSLTDNGSGVVSVATGAAGGGVSYASYTSGASDNLTNSTAANVLNLDTETVDASSLASVASDTITVASAGDYLVSCNVTVDAGSAFNGRIVLTLDSTFNMIEAKGYATANGILSDTLYVGPVFYQFSGGATIGIKMDNYCGFTLTATVNDVTLVKVG